MVGKTDKLGKEGFTNNDVRRAIALEESKGATLVMKEYKGKREEAFMWCRQHGCKGFQALHILHMYPYCNKCEQPFLPDMMPSWGEQAKEATAEQATSGQWGKTGQTGKATRGRSQSNTPGKGAPSQKHPHQGRGQSKTPKEKGDSTSAPVRTGGGYDASAAPVVSTSVDAEPQASADAAKLDDADADMIGSRRPPERISMNMPIHRKLQILVEEHEYAEYCKRKKEEARQREEAQKQAAQYTHIVVGELPLSIKHIVETLEPNTLQLELALEVATAIKASNILLTDEIGHPQRDSLRDMRVKLRRVKMVLRTEFSEIDALFLDVKQEPDAQDDEEIGTGSVTVEPIDVDMVKKWKCIYKTINKALTALKQAAGRKEQASKACSAMQDLSQIINKELADATMAADQAQAQFSKAVEESTQYLQNLCKPPETEEPSEQRNQLLAKEKEALESQQILQEQLRELQKQRIGLIRQGGVIPTELLHGTSAQLNQAMAAATQIMNGCEDALGQPGGYEAVGSVSASARSVPYNKEGTAKSDATA